ncbi:SxtJ family membrane protein [Thalassospiraceae bacterium LMO-JJ14]|nr:SxtJ family membrane protein [Thalassospiraceae bacterium LMO-JJ14]
MSIRQTDRAFGLTFAAVFTIIGGVLWFFGGAPVLWPFITAGVFAILALAVPGVLLPLNRLWSWFGGKLGHINNKLILGLFYILFMIPFGLVMRLAGRDPMTRKIRGGQETYWQQPARQLDRDTLRDMY